MAAVHFKSAASINPASSVLHCYIAMTLHRQGLHDRALTKLQVRRCGDIVAWNMDGNELPILTNAVPVYMGAVNDCVGALVLRGVMG